MSISKRLFTTGSVLALACTLSACSSTSALDLNTGDCFELPDDIDIVQGFELSSLETVPCVSAHDAQVVGEEELSDGDFPGQEEIQTRAVDFCSEAFEDFVGIPYTESSLDVVPLGPSKDSWERANDRALLCVAVSTEQVSESFKDSQL